MVMCGLQELKYDEGSGADTKDEDEGGESDGLETHPCGSDESWTFFYNLIHPENGMNVKLGDCVEVVSEESSEESSKRVVRCQFLLRDKRKTAWVSGYEMIRTSEIPSLMKGKKRRRRGVEEFPVSGDRVILDGSECFIRLSTISHIHCALPLTDYEFGKPRGLKGTSVFTCGFRFDPQTASTMHFVIPDFKTCFNPLVWEHFLDPHLDPVVIVSSNDQQMTPSILRKEGTPRKSSLLRRISFSPNLVQQFEYVKHDE